MLLVARLLGLLRFGVDGEYPLLTIDRCKPAPLREAGGESLSSLPLVSNADDAAPTIAASVFGADSIARLAI